MSIFVHNYDCLRYLQPHMSTGMISFVWRSAATSTTLTSSASIQWTNNRIVERAREMACFSVELHAVTIDYSSVWGWDLGFECWQCIQQLLVYNYNREGRNPISPSLVIILHKFEKKWNFNLTALLLQCLLGQTVITNKERERKTSWPSGTETHGMSCWWFNLEEITVKWTKQQISTSERSTFFLRVYTCKLGCNPQKYTFLENGGPYGTFSTHSHPSDIY